MHIRNSNSVTEKTPKRVAIVISNPAVSPTAGSVGFWWSELTHIWFALTEKDYQIDLFSPNGGRCEADALSDPRDASGYSASDLISMGFIPHLRSLNALVIRDPQVN